MNKCISGKKSYPTQEMAEEALIDAHIVYDYGRTSGPIAVYLCEDCGQYHLTSAGIMNEKLAQYRKDGTLEKLRRARQWEGKYRK
ncbi:MAG: hypothetical protein MUE95_15020 [Cyclobacteriaceae bacterium]|jgi:hypothetical protein|nr:hypothetical protein [Cyclobacteriaceae bacterium]